MALPAGDSDLENIYTAQEVIDVSVDDDIYVDQSATDQYAIHQYKDFSNASNSCTVLWKGQTNCPPTLSPVALQIYNQTSGLWETLDSDNTSNINTDFILTAVVSDLTNYKDGDSLVACRVYQLDI